MSVLPAAWHSQLSLRPDALSRRTLVLLTTGVVLIGIALRLVWLARIGWHVPELQWQGTPLLSSGDGYWFAAGAGDLLNRAWAGNARLPLVTDHALVFFAWLGTKLTPWSLDQVILYLPALLTPLAAIPVVGIGRALGAARLGLVAALAFVVAPALFQRSAAGYFDTDMFALLAPLAVAFHLVRNSTRDSLYAAAWLAVYPWLYNQGSTLGLGLALVAAWLWRRDPRALVLLAVSQVPVPPLLRVLLVLAVALTWSRLPATLSTPSMSKRALSVLLGGLALVALAVAIVTGPSIIAKLAYYLDPDAATAGGVTFGVSADFVSETRAQGFVDLATRVAGAVPLFVVAMLGAALVGLRHPRLVIFAPVVGLGLFTVFGGARFTIYLTPIFAIGIAYVATWLADRVAHAKLRAVATTVLAFGAAAPAAARDWVAYTRPPLINAEAQALEALRTKATPDATTIAWWDDGYPALYFARTRTLIDGGRREADVSLVAEMFMGSQRAARNLSALALATRDDIPADWAIAPTLFQRGTEASTLAAFLARLGSDYRAPSPSPAYVYLPLRLLTIVPVIDQLRPQAGPVASRSPYYRLMDGAKVDGNRIHLGTIEVDAAALILSEAGATRPLKTIYSVRGTGPSFELRTRTKHPDAATSGIYLHDAGLFIELDERYLSSTLLQLLVFEKPEPDTFELVFSNAAARIYKVRP